MDYAYDVDLGDRVRGLEDNRSEVASQLAAQSVMISAITEKVDGGFALLVAKLDRMDAQRETDRQQQQTDRAQLQSLREADDRQRARRKWIATAAGSVLAAVTTAALVLLLHLR